MKLLLPLEIIALILHVLVICTSLWLLPRSAWRKLHRLIRHNPPSRLAVFRNPTPMTVHDKFCISIIATLNLFLFLMFFDDCLALYSISNNNEEGFLKQLFPSNALFSAIFRFSGILFGFGACVLLPHFTAYKFRRFFFNSTEKTKYEKWVFCFEKIVLPIAATIVALVFILTDVIPFDESFPWLRLVIVVLNTQALVMFIALLEYRLMKQTLDYVKETCKRDEELIHRLKGSSLSSSTSSLASSSTHIRTPAAHEITLLTKHLAARKQLGKQIMKRLYSIFIVLLISTILIGVATVIAEFVLRNYMTSFYKIMMAFAVATMLVSIRLAHITYIGVLQYKKDAKLNKTLKLGSTFETTNAFQAHDDELDELDYGGLEIEEFLED